MLDQIFQVTVIAGSAMGLWLHNWPLLLVCVVAVVAVYASKTTGRSSCGFTESTTDDEEDDKEDDEEKDEEKDDSDDDDFDGEIVKDEDTKCESVKLTQRFGKPPQEKPKTYDDSFEKGIQPFLGLEMGKRNMRNPSRYIEPLSARKKLMEGMAEDLKSHAVKDKYYIPASECGARTRPAF